MPSNVEIKARIASVDALLPRALALSDDEHAQLIHQDDTFFSVPAGRLKLRVFADGAGELIHYERPDVDGPKRSDYRIAEVTDPDALRGVLERACGVLGRVRKERLLVLVGQTRVHLDRVDGLGDFIELEVLLADGQPADEGHAIARALMVSLGIDAHALVAAAYIDLLAGSAARGD
jgi:predicted adenylyl cyclase CyaB